MHDGVLYLGSEIKALLAGGVPASWDVHSYFSRSFYFGEDTLFKGIKSLEAGHFLTSNSQGLRIQRYWDLSYPIDDPARQVDEEGVLEEVRAAIYESISLRLRSDVPVAFYLSGGIDSSAALGVASRISGHSFPAFTIAFVEDAEYNEAPYARTMADHVGADHRLVPVTSRMLADNFERAVWHNEIPFFNSHGISKFILSKALRDAGYKVVLTGEGADEIFAGYPHFRRDNELANSLSTVAREQATYTDGLTEENWVKKVVGSDISWIQNQHGMISMIRPMLNQELLSATGTIDPFRSFIDRIDVSNKVLNRHPVHMAMYLWAKSFLPNFVLTTLGDRMEMANSIEGRTPFLDHHMAELSCRIPVSMKIRGKVEKHVLRRAVADLLPKEISDRKKHYFRAPPAMVGGQSAMWEMVCDIINGPAADSLPFYSKDALKKILSVPTNNSRDELLLMDPLVMEVASVALLQKNFGLSS